MNFKIIYCIFNLCFFIGCTTPRDNKINYIEEFKWEDSCTIDLCVLNDTSLWKYPRQIECLDSVLIILDDVDNHFLHLYNANSGSFIMNFSKKGQGPGELLSCEKFHLSKDKKKLSVYDILSRKIVVYDIDSMLIGKSKCDEFYLDYSKLSDNEIPTIIYDMIPYVDSLYLIKSNHCNMRYGIYSHKNENILNLYTTYLEGSFNYNSVEELWSVFSSNTFTLIRPDNLRFMNATRIGGILEIFDINNETCQISSLHNIFIYEPIYNVAQGSKPIFVVSNEKTLFGFEDVYVTNDYIYTLLYDSAIKKKPQAISILNWDGKPVHKINFNTPVTKICVDENNHRIYLLCLNEENGFDLSYCEMQ